MRTAIVLAVIVLHLPQAFAQSPFYPLQVGNEWHYRSGDEKVVIRVIGHEVIDVVDEKEKASKLPTAIVQLHSGMRRPVTERYAVAADGIYRLSTAGHQIRPPLRIFKLPVKPDDNWAVQSESEGVPLRGTFTISNEPVVVPYKKFASAWRVTCKDFQIGGETTTISSWFVEDVGMVKQHVVVGQFERVLELEAVTIKK